jgi:hypothetical protein
MGKTRPPQPVKLVVGLLASAPALLEEAQAALAEAYGEIDDSSAPVRWTVSSYYADEMGPDLTRQFLSFARLIAADVLMSIKAATNDLENRWRRGGKRRVNIDPGYVGLTKLVLATTKDAAQRIYLGDGLYAEPTLAYEDGSFRPYTYTYRDYADAGGVRFFNGVRARYLQQLRES